MCKRLLTNSINTKIYYIYSEKAGEFNRITGVATLPTKAMQNAHHNHSSDTPKTSTIFQV